MGLLRIDQRDLFGSLAGLGGDHLKSLLGLPVRAGTCGCEKTASSNSVGSLDTSIDARLFSLAAAGGCPTTGGWGGVVSSSANREGLRSVVLATGSLDATVWPTLRAGAARAGDIGAKSGTASADDRPVVWGEDGFETVVAGVLIAEEMLKAVVDVFVEKAAAGGCPKAKPTCEGAREGDGAIPEDGGSPVAERVTGGRRSEAEGG